MNSVTKYNFQSEDILAWADAIFCKAIVSIVLTSCGRKEVGSMSEYTTVFSSHSSLQWEYDREARHYPVPWFPWALWEQPELCVENQRHRRSRDSGKWGGKRHGSSSKAIARADDTADWNTFRPGHISPHCKQAELHQLILELGGIKGLGADGSTGNSMWVLCNGTEI